MDNLVLIDTSVWIEYFRKKNPVFNQINELAENQRLTSLKLIMAELIQGARSQSEIDVINDLAEVATILSEPLDAWQKAGKLSYDLRRDGKTVGLADCYIAVVGQAYGSFLYSFDKHFEIISGSIDIRFFLDSGQPLL